MLVQPEANAILAPWHEKVWETLNSMSGVKEELLMRQYDILSAHARQAASVPGLRWCIDLSDGV